MIKQNKGKDLHKVPKSKLSEGPYYVSKKYDGHYIQIQKMGQDIEFTTSGGKPFYIKGLADYINIYYQEDFHIECEYNYDCEGLLGDRGKSAILTTYRTNFEKDITVHGDSFKDLFTVLDMLGTDMMFKSRLAKLTDMFYGADWFRVPTQTLCPSLEEAKEMADEWVKEGYEGAMLKTPNHLYMPGKRVNSIIKIKPRLTADLLCIDVKEGTGKYVGMIGALLLEDSEGRQVWAGSGLDDYSRTMSTDYFIGTIYEIEYERIDETYIQPIIKYRRGDKSERD